MSALDFTHQRASRPGGSGEDIIAQVGFCRLGVRDPGLCGLSCGEAGHAAVLLCVFLSHGQPAEPLVC